MKIILLISILNFALFSSLFSQNAVSLNLNHLLDGEAFAYDVNSKNDLGHDFYLTRLQYYISGISFFDENDQEYVIDDTYLLVTAGVNGVKEINLGEHDVELITKLKFHIGVDEETNHLDPAQYPSNHALAPKDPSMHWGWEGGYRFIALEGKSSPSLDQSLNLHCIGDDNYAYTEIPVSSKAVDGKITIEISAEYSHTLAGIDISTGVIQHGAILEIPFMVNNFITKVFTATGNSVGIEDEISLLDFEIYPNPSLKDEMIRIDLDQWEQVQFIEIYNSNGKLVQSLRPESDVITLDISSSGLYTANLRNKSGQIIGNKHFIKM